MPATTPALAWHPSGSVVRRPGQPDRPIGSAGYVPAGYTKLRSYNLAVDEGWTLESGKPANADGVDRPANMLFGQGPQGKSALILGNRDTAGGTFYTADAKGLFAPIPNYHRVRFVVEWDTMVGGMWPAVWERPISGEGEIDWWEKFGGHGQWASGPPSSSYPEDAATLHTSPYDSTHKQLQRPFPVLGPGLHTIEGELKPNLLTVWVDGTTTVSISQSQFDSAAGRSAWAPMFGDASKNWYLRLTLQAGGADGGTIPAGLNQWRCWVHELTTYVPAA